MAELNDREEYAVRRLLTDTLADPALTVIWNPEIVDALFDVFEKVSGEMEDVSDMVEILSDED